MSKKNKNKINIIVLISLSVIVFNNLIAQTTDIILVQKLINKGNTSVSTIIPKGYIFVDTKCENKCQNLELYDIEIKKEYSQKISSIEWKITLPPNMTKPIYLDFKVRCKDRHFDLKKDGKFEPTSFQSTTPDTFSENSQEIAWDYQEDVYSTITSKPLKKTFTFTYGIQNCENSLKDAIKECFIEEKYSIKNFELPLNLVTPNCNLTKIQPKVTVIESITNHKMYFKIISIEKIVGNNVLLTGEIITAPENFPDIIAAKTQ